MRAHANSAEAQVQRLLVTADITVDGDRPWDITVHDRRFYGRVLAGGSLALGESYMDGWWRAAALDAFVAKILVSDIPARARRDPRVWWPVLKARLFNRQAGARAYHIGQAHYDLGDELFEAMLDTRLVYSCAYWKEAETLDQAQVDKLDLICRKLHLEPGIRLLDIGCGWGSLARYAAEQYGCEVVGLTVSQDQARKARELCQGLPIEIRCQDYREFAKACTQAFDAVVSVGMFEHVGSKNYRAYMEVVNRVLVDGGLQMVHTIGQGTSTEPGDGEPWILRYIFPDGQLPALAQVAAAAEGLFIVEDVHNFGPYYDLTLMSWHENFQQHWPSLSKQGEQYDERFKRMWEYYLAFCAASFRQRYFQLWQVVFVKKPKEIYQPVR